MICSSVNLDRFILSVLRWADSSYSWRSFRGSRHMASRENLSVLDELVEGGRHSLDPSISERTLPTASRVTRSCIIAGETRSMRDGWSKERTTCRRSVRTCW